MYKIIFFADSYKHFESAIKEYEKRLGKSIEIIKLKPSKKKDEISIIDDETNILNEKLKDISGYKILLYITGEIFSTEKLSQIIEDKKQNFGNIIFIIGGAYGINIEKLKNMIDLKLSFSPMTFPHSMAYLILLEQIYRIEMIKKGSSYHH
ncbi:23S rRNA (pseudouridine(1915)-N(3))-methyltransferase RlmH [Candidatus Gracilibacteria bacterium]|nr:23S rRNA (pseudouridine(1915)-N(3))-methyltransferase RlmH [Candidatus Gracilibacteria bacterium]